MSASMKAIKLESNNYSRLAAQYDADEDFFEDAVGLYLVSDFGEGQIYDIVKLEDMNKLFDKTGKELDNGYFEVIRRTAVVTPPVTTD